MNVGRNDPCYCGSGKKYKKCCLAKDEEQARKNAPNPYAAIASPPKTKRDEEPKPPPDPRVQAWNARWQEFKSVNYEDRVALFTRTLGEPELMSGEMAFEMLNELFDQAAERKERDRFDALTESLRERLPDVYEKEEKYVIEWRVINALALGRHEIIPSFTNDLARLAGIDIDKWDRVEGRLAYHGHLTTLVEAMRLAWPMVRTSPEIVPWGIDEFGYRAVQYEMLDYIAQTPSPHANDPALHERIEGFYSKAYSRDRIAHSINILIGQADREWIVADFDLPLPEEEAGDGWGDIDDWYDEEGRDEAERDEEEGDDEEWDDEQGDDEEWDDEGFDEEDDSRKRAVEAPHPAEVNLRDLTIRFIRYAHDLEGLPYSKAELARLEMLTFIRRRHRGALEYRESMLASMLRREGMNREPLKKYQEYKHLLIPDRERFEHYLSDLFQSWAPQPHRAAALMELTPAWLRFLQSRGLIDDDLRKRTLRELEPLAGDLLGMYRRRYRDPALCEAMERWKWNAGKEPR